MCSMVEEYGKGCKLEDVINMLKENIPLETALRITKIERATYDKYAAAGEERLQ